MTITSCPVLEGKLRDGTPKTCGRYCSEYTFGNKIYYKCPKHGVVREKKPELTEQEVRDALNANGKPSPDKTPDEIIDELLA